VPPGARLDDVLDAFAALWVARRIEAGAARPLPPRPPRDGRGLRMAIWS
jgi:predicted RNase H-like nuclease